MNNTDSSTMFAHIVSRLTNRTEDVAVCLLTLLSALLTSPAGSRSSERLSNGRSRSILV